MTGPGETANGRAGEGFRPEIDSLGTVGVPDDALWGAQTQRAIVNFAIGDELMPRELIRAMAQIKQACAEANQLGGRLPDGLAELIVIACREIVDGRHDRMFPLKVWMTGSGTQLNMNVNEVIANRCSQLTGQPLGSKRPVHPNDHVNMSQSTNDVFPTAMHLAAVEAVCRRLLPAVGRLQRELAARASEWNGVVKVGRTHMMDATPLTLGQEFSGYAAMLAAGGQRIERVLPEVCQLTLGGTAVGTGINSWPGFAGLAVARLAELTGLPLTVVDNRFAAQGAHDSLVQLSGCLKTLAVSVYKIANDIRLLASGPRAGIGELQLPANEPGSSIMPGKVNPTQCEVLTMIAVQVMANDYAVSLAGAGGILEMNVYKPVLIYNLLQSIRLLADGLTSFAERAVSGLRADRQRIAQFVEQSLMLVTALSPAIGYDRASEIAHLAAENGLTLRQAAMQLGYVSREEYDRLVVPALMVEPR
ncbi:MAG: class II fumarate hydratase [Negativicutes bacterium]|nr:class II fumarate hydratase [Negativicutes bacterium]